MQLNRHKPPRPIISLVSMIDVLMIMLVFFMVTSTYLNLDMIPMAESTDDPAPSPQPAAEAPGTATMLIRLGPDGVPYVRGQAQDAAGLAALVGDHLAGNPLAPVVVLPSGNADTQALVSLMDTATRAGAVRLRIIRLEARP